MPNLNEAANLYEKYNKQIDKGVAKMNKNEIILKFMRQYRVVTVALLIFMMYMGLMITDWYLAIENPNNSQGAFASAVLLAIVGVFKFWMTSVANDKTD